ncbi:PPOX class F420-dependent enzyme [Cnuibacter physcomitrellae]|uniref:PPOX class F420-dependent enzyme n=1 Tax=Cnuibacter physcomitrellae TaxID=1619308 RepID=A0A1X9LPX1_9MICO|nr:pyridoxamine 5'-phosphate oxidase family protein [Cnuibacter physcomitrellae]ARJ03930.1 PPOX class F420-dependent enzyme [Cnuibacter physcomitrellae]GGI39833.1 PPOX class F420-dependent enzyme [Cnuibacter physcomitrellae]
MSREWDDVRGYFDRVTVAHVATLMPDGAPHTVLVWVGTTDDGLELFMAAGSRKDRNLAGDPRIAFSVTNPDNALDMAFVRGKAVERLAGEAAYEIVDRLARKYTGADYDLREGMVAYRVRADVSWARDHTGD